MTTLFPGALDNFTDPVGTAMLGATTPKHSEHHANLNDAVEAIEATIGETGSTDPASIEKRLVDVIAAAAAAASAASVADAKAVAVDLDLTTHIATLGTAALTDAADYATAAQGATADAAAASIAALGTSAALDVGTSANNVVQLDGASKLPPVDGSQLLNLPGGGGGTSDHDLLTNLDHDTHLQYHNDARGDARYAPLAKGVTNGDAHDHAGGDGAQIAYSSLSGTPTLGTAAAAATGDFEAAGAVSTHNTVTTAHGISAFGATLVDDADAATARTTLILGNVDNTSDANKPVSTAQQAALNLKANIASPTFTGTVSGITAAMVGAPSGSGTSTGTNTGDSATPAETTTTIGTLIDGATSKTTPVDADQIGLVDSAASNVLKKLSWANLKAAVLKIPFVFGPDDKDTGPILTLMGDTLNQFESGRIRFRERVANEYQGAYIHYDGVANELLIGMHNNIDSLTASDAPAIRIARANSAVAITGGLALAGANPNFGLLSAKQLTDTYLSGFTLLSSSGSYSARWWVDSSGVQHIYNSSTGTGKVAIGEPGAALGVAYDSASVTAGSGTLMVNGNAGFGTASPSARVHAMATTEQMRAGYDAANYESSTTSSAGKTTKALVGTSPDIKWSVSDATTNALYDLATFSKNSTGAGAAGLGARINLAAKSSTTTDTLQGALSASWVDATHATRKARTRIWAADSTGLREGIRLEADGTQVLLGFYGGNAVAKPTALTATVAAAPAGGTGTAAGGWDTSGNRDLAIATINNLKTRVDQLETKLQALGLLT